MNFKSHEILNYDVAYSLKPLNETKERYITRAIFIVCISCKARFF